MLCQRLCSSSRGVERLDALVSTWASKRTPRAARHESGAHERAPEHRECQMTNTLLTNHSP